MKTKMNTYSVIVSSINSMVFGFSLISIGYLNKVASTNFKNVGLLSYDTLFTIAASAIFLGGVIFNIFNRIKNDKTMILFSTAANFLGYFGIILFPNIYNIILCRTIIGLGAGCACFIVPQYIFKLAPPETSGLWCSLHAININIGIFIGQACTPLNTNNSWKLAYYPTICILGLTLILDFFILNVQTEQKAEMNLKELFNNKNSRKSIICVLLLHTSQHLCGVDYLSIFLALILENSYLKIISVAFLAIPSVIISSILLNKYGRKYLYVISAFLVGLSTAVMVKNKIIGLLIFVLGYNIGISNVPWVVPNEVSPSNYVPPLTKIGILSNWISAFLLLFLFTFIHDTIGDWGYLTYSVTMVFMIFYTLLFVPETKGNSNFI